MTYFRRNSKNQYFIWDSVKRNGLQYDKILLSSPKQVCLETIMHSKQFQTAY